MWVEVKTADKIFFGKIKETTKKELFLQLMKTESMIQLNEIRYVSTIGLFPLWKILLKNLFSKPTTNKMA